MLAVPRHRSPRPPAPASATAPSFTSASKHSQQQPIPLSRRLLFPHLPPTSDLPPLLAWPSAPPELTHELYELIALALRAFVHPWWSKITRYDKEFFPEITRILTVVLRALETRVLAADLPQLVFRDIPALITQHYRDYRNAEPKLSTSYASGGGAYLPQLFHQLQPHMALSADGRIDEEYFRQIVDHVLKSCLAEEDYNAEVERYIIREVILNVLLKDVIPNVTQPWFLHKLLLDLIGSEEDTSLPKLSDTASVHSDPTSRSSSPSPSSFSFQTLLVVFLSAVQTLSGACLAVIHAYKQTLVTIKRVNQVHDVKPTTVPSPRPHSVSHRSIPRPPRVTTQTSNSGQTSPSSSVSSVSSSCHFSQNTAANESYESRSQSTDSVPGDLYRPLFVMIAEILTMHERFASATIMSTLLMLSSSAGTFLDRLLLHLLTTSLSTSVMVQMVRTVKRTLFPNGYAAPPPPDPTAEEQAAMRERLVRWKACGLPGHLMPFVLGHTPEVTLGTALDPLSSAPCNVHLVVLILDRIVLALFPELGIDPF